MAAMIPDCINGEIRTFAVIAFGGPDSTDGGIGEDMGAEKVLLGKGPPSRSRQHPGVGLWILRLGRPSSQGHLEFCHLLLRVSHFRQNSANSFFLPWATKSIVHGRWATNKNIGVSVRGGEMLLDEIFIYKSSFPLPR